MAREYMNVVEAWPIIDTVLIARRPEMDKFGWFQSYLALGNVIEIPFFASRNKSQVGLAYNNQDATNVMPYAFIAYSIGVHFMGPAALTEYENEDLVPPVYSTSQMFGLDLLKHCSMQFKVQQDFLAEQNCLMTPPGYGLTTMQYPTGEPHPFDDASSLAGTTINGEPHLDNRFKFPRPLRIPRNATFKAILQFSEYGKYILANLPGPGFFTLGQKIVEPDILNKFFVSCAMIQLSLIGKREVQQRGELHVG